MCVAMLRGATEARQLHTRGGEIATGAVPLPPRASRNLPPKPPRPHPTDRAYRDAEVNRAREYVLLLERTTGKSIHQLAAEAGVAKTTIYRKKAGGQVFRPETLAKIAAAAGVAMAPATPLPGAPIPRGPAEDASPYPLDEGEPLAPALTALAAGSDAIKTWRVTSNALEDDGILRGDIVQVDTSRAPRSGEKCLAQADGRHVLRVFEEAGPVALLHTRTRDANLQKTLVVDNDRVTVLGILLPHRLRSVA
jgi:hypothetical protein